MYKKQIFKPNDVFIVAEAGNNHEGNFLNAKKIIEEAAKCGVDAIKFQTFKTENFISKSNKKAFKKYKKFELSYDEFKSLSDIAKKNKIIFFSTPLDLESANFLNKIQPIFKIASSDNNFNPLIDTVVKFNKPIIISTGLINYREISNLYTKLKSKIKNFRPNHSISFLHCLSEYPIKHDNVNLNSIKFLKQNFKDCIIGYSDHFIGNKIAASSVLVGSRIVEKHFTLDNNFSGFRDHRLSADPINMSKLVKEIRYLTKILGKEEKKPTTREIENKINFRRSAIYKKDLDINDKLNKSDIVYVRPGNFLSEKQIRNLINKKIKRVTQKGDFIKKKDFV